MYSIPFASPNNRHNGVRWDWQEWRVSETRDTCAYSRFIIPSKLEFPHWAKSVLVTLAHAHPAFTPRHHHVSPGQGMTCATSDMNMPQGGPTLLYRTRIPEPHWQQWTGAELEYPGNTKDCKTAAAPGVYNNHNPPKMPHLSYNTAQERTDAGPSVSGVLSVWLYNYSPV